MLTIVGFIDVKHASEGGDAGYFRLHRDDHQGVVSVDFVIDSRVGVSGIATNGVDYALLPGTTETHSRGRVTFPDGVLTVDIPIVPIDDLLVEGTEAVTVTLLPTLAMTPVGEPLYTLGANMQATLLLGDASPVASGTPRVSGVPEITRGNDFTLRFHANGADVLSWKVNWGDNSPTQTFSGTTTEAVHFYQNGNKDYNISVEAVYQVVTPAQPAPREGLPSSYWKSNTSNWKSYKTGDNYEKVFGVSNASKPGTLSQALATSGNGIQALWRESTAAILNASHPNLNYRYSVTEVISMVQDAYATGQYDAFANVLALENAIGGDIKNAPKNIPQTVKQYTAKPVHSLYVRNEVFVDAPIPPGSPSISGVPVVDENNDYTLHFSPSEADVVSWKVNWGDGSRIEVYPGSATSAVHFYPDGDAYFTITVEAVKEVVIPGKPAPFEGLSQGYWKNHASDWKVYKPTDNYETIFSVTHSQKPGTLMQAVNSGGGGIIALWRQSVAALLNASHPNLNYRYTVAEVIAMVQDAYRTGKYEAAKDILERENTREGDIKKQSVGTQETIQHVVHNLKQLLFVRNVPPTLTITGDRETMVGQEYVISLHSYDPGIYDVITEWTVDWGDGTQTKVPGDRVFVTHTYAQQGEYTIFAAGEDKDGIWNSNTLDVLVYSDVADEWIPLVEHSDFHAQYTYAFRIPDNVRTLEISIRGLSFDRRSEGMIKDAFEAALLDAKGYSLVDTIRTTRDSFLNITEGDDPLLASGVRYDAVTGKIYLDISQLVAGAQAFLIVRLVNNDTDTETSVEVKKQPDFLETIIVNPNPVTLQENAGHRQRIDFTHLQDVTPSVEITYGTTTFNDHTNTLRAGVTLTHAGTYQIRGPLLVGIKNISDPSVMATGYDGVAPDGMIYYDASHFAFVGNDGTFNPEDVIRGLDLQFSNPNRIQFAYDIVILAHINRPPGFVSQPKTEVRRGNEYVYQAQAVDPENDDLHYLYCWN
ncbi:MAG: PKD domain-containing protein [Planctomycetaceae bacterium]|nr:PKD domain-containing protein [Planctomycetaceae bacterium]